MKKIASFYPTLGLSWATVGILVAGMIAASTIVSIISFITGNSELINNSWVLLICYILPFLFIAGFIYLIQNNAVEQEIIVKKNIPFFIFPLLLIFVPLVSLIIEPLTSWMPIPEFLQEMFEKMFQLNVATGLMTVVAAPLCEEWLCRGVIAKGLLRHTSPKKAILWSAFIFAVIHMNPWQAVPAFISGLLLGYVYWKTRSLWPCIFIHFVNNGLSFLLMNLFSEMDVNSSTQDIFGANYGWIYLSAVALFIPIGYLLYRVLNKTRPITD